MLYTGRYVYFVLLVAGGTYLAATYAALSPTTAVHFNAQGMADGWANPSAYVGILALVGVIVPLGVVLLISILSTRAPGVLNLPNRAERLLPQNTAEAGRRIRAYIWWLPVLMLGL